MAGTNGAEGMSIQDLAVQMLGLTDNPENEDNEGNDEGTPEPQAGHPAWQAILDNVAPEHRQEVMDQLHEWDAGVSRRFQKIHDEYAPLKELEDYGDPAGIKQAVEVYNALLENPKDTWETIGRIYGLASEVEEDEEDEEYAELPLSVREKLAKLDEHERVLSALTQRELDAQAREEEAQEDQALEDYLQQLTEEYGEYDEDYVTGLIAAGIDGEEAVARFQEFSARFQAPIATPAPKPTKRVAAPQVMSGSGGVPTSGSVDVGKMSKQETQALVIAALGLTQSD